MKKVLVVFVLTLIFCLCACAANTKPSEEQRDSSVSETITVEANSEETSAEELDTVSDFSDATESASESQEAFIDESESIASSKEESLEESQIEEHISTEEGNLSPFEPVKEESTASEQQTKSEPKESVEETEPTKKVEESEPNSSVTEPNFDIIFWVDYVKEYAESIGLNLNPEAVDCWDNPTYADAFCIYLERDLSGRLNRYAKDPDVTDVWIWYESIGNGEYLIYIGYA